MRTPGARSLSLAAALLAFPLTAPAAAQDGSLGHGGSVVRLVSATRDAGVLTVVLGIGNRGDGSVSASSLRSYLRPSGQLGISALDPATGTLGALLEDGTACRCSLLPSVLSSGSEVLLRADLADPGGESVDLVLDAFQPLAGIRPTGTAGRGAGTVALAGRTLQPLRRVRAGAAEVSSGGSVERVELRTDVLFAVDSATLTPRARTSLQAAAQALRSQPKRRIGVYGNTDDAGTAAHNLDLSRRRAQAVQAALAPLLGAGWAFDVQGYGETKPVAPNEKDDGSPYPDGRTRNRRVDVVILA